MIIYYISKLPQIGIRVCMHGDSIMYIDRAYNFN